MKIFSALLIGIFFAGFASHPRPTPTVQGLPTVTITIKKVGNTWKALNSTSGTTIVKVKKNQKIVISPVGTNVYVQFGELKLVGQYTLFVQDGKPSPPLVVKADSGTYVYAAFCDGPKVYAEGDSPPKIIVD